MVNWMSLERLADVLGAVAADREVHRRRQLGLEVGQQRVMPSVTSIVLLPGCRMTARVIAARCPLFRIRRRR